MKNSIEIKKSERQSRQVSLLCVSKRKPNFIGNNNPQSVNSVNIVNSDSFLGK
jgi:hypothetical protein